MIERWRNFWQSFDWLMFGAAVLLTTLGLMTMYSFQGDNHYFEKQLIWLGVAIAAFFVAMIPDYRFLRVGNSTFYIFLASIFLLLLIPIFGSETLGATQRLHFAFFAFQPSDLARLVLVIVLAKYFAKRHEQIGSLRHIFASGIYAAIYFVLLYLQPDLGTAIIVFFIWLCMVLVAGIRVKHFLSFGAICLVAAVLAWNFGLADYQKTRIYTFLDPLSDIQGDGYNAYQSIVAVGSGQLLGKGVGYGTQSKLLYLPYPETDFIFAAFAEEWGLVGSFTLFGIFLVLIWRLLRHAVLAASNFETLFIAGVAILLITQFIIHVGINIGVLPVTGTTIPFLSYGGSHLVMEFFALGMVMAMSRYAHTRVTAKNLPFD